MVKKMLLYIMTTSREKHFSKYPRVTSPDITASNVQPFKFTVVYKKKGKYLYLADTMSRAALNVPTPSHPHDEVS